MSAAARTPPSAGRRRPAPRRAAAAATRRSARPGRVPSAAPRRHRRSGPGSARRACGVSAISGTSTIALRPASSAACDRLQVDLGLARAGDAVEQEPPAGRRAGGAAERLEHRASAPRCSAVSGGAASRRPRRRGGARARGGARCSSRDQAARLQPAQAARSRARRRPRRPVALERSSSSRWRSVRRRCRRRARAPPGVGQLGDEHRACAGPRRPRPGGSTSASARAGSSSTRPPSTGPARRGRRGRPTASTASGSARRLGASSERSASPSTTPSAAAAERHAQQRADLDAGLLGPQPVVERAAHRARAGQRLDAGDHRRVASRIARPSARVRVECGSG